MIKRGKRPELLSPAGNPEKLKAAVRYGADAVYLSGRAYGMRAACENFDLPQIRDAVAYAHAAQVKVYLAVNIMPHDREYPGLQEFFTQLSDIRLDGLIVADLGVMSLAKEMLPHIPLHISTQANVLSASACRAYAALGARRIILGRELSLAEIRNIRRAVPEDLELECFVHGSMCMAYSGRCLLSSHFTGRDANRGACAQPCRWKYRIRNTPWELVEEKRPDDPLPITEENGETFVMSSRDTCMIAHIPELIEAGIDSFKLEGRMRSAYYTAVVTNTYRMAIDAYVSGERETDPRWIRELDSVSHRPYHTGFFYDRPSECANTEEGASPSSGRLFLADIVSYDPERGEAKMRQQNKFSRGDTVEILQPGKTGRSFRVEALFDEAHLPLEAVPHPHMLFFMKVPFPVAAGDFLRLSGEEGETRDT